jgi:hypothetical protein
MKDGAEAKKEEQQDQMIFHGSSKYSSVVLTFLDGGAPFEAAFEKFPIRLNREGNESRNDFMFELVNLLHCDISARYCTQRA